LGVEDDGFAEGVEFEGVTASAEDQFDAEAEVGGFSGARDEVVDYSFGETVGEFMGDGVGDEDDGEGGGVGAGAGEKLADGDAGEVDVKEREGWRIWGGDGGECRFGGEDDFRAGSGGEEDGFDGGEESWVRGGQEVGRRGCGHGGKTSVRGASAEIRNYLGSGGRYFEGSNDLNGGIG
jgi:hypothetical protein